MDSKFDWNEIMTPPVVTSDGKDIGKVDCLEDLEFVVKDGLIDPAYYRIPGEKVDSYIDGKVVLGLSEEQVKSQFKRRRPGYYSHTRDKDAERTSNTLA